MRGNLFEDAAIARIAAASGGTPRKTNILCDTVLVYGFSQAAKTIGLGVVEEDKARFGVMGRQGLPRGAAGQGAAGWVTDLAEERTSRSRDDAAARAVLASMFGRKKYQRSILAQ